ncbi:MAG: glycosyltransferase family 2 protein [Paludibacter sp.]|nr:glycosyltransferase family 2 protein [Paludibacter sp.]
MNKIAILLTCHNRKDKTIHCLTSLYKALELYNAEMTFDVFLVDDGCTDGTSDAIKELFSNINVISGSGDLFWSGGMILAWKTALMQDKEYDAFLLLNDDVILMKDFFTNLLVSHEFCLKQYNQSGIYVCSTKDMLSSKISYGGTLITHRGIRIKSNLVKPSDTPIVCTMANANILLVTKSVVDKIGILDERYYHQFADFDYTFVASQRKIPVLVCPGFGGYCDDDHGKDWLGPGSSLKKRISFLYSPLGLSYNDQIYYLKKNFKFQFPYYFLMLWLKTFCPFVWEKYKKYN